MMLRTPLIIVNAKAYKEGTGTAAVRLARACGQAAKRARVAIALAVQPSDIPACSEHAPVLAQHVDAVTPGPRTGHVLPEAVKAAGAIGTLLNHSERRLHIAGIIDGIAICRRLGLATVVCAATPGEAADLARLKPDYLAVEPPELIGGDISVSIARPEVITDTTSQVRQVPVLCGAGVKSEEDVRTAWRLGAKGILVASGVVLAKDPYGALLDLAKGFKSR
jgi:triosephosphate isomerase